MTQNPRVQTRFSTTEAPYFSPFSLPDYSEDPFMQKLWSIFSTPLRFSTVSRLASASAGSQESPKLASASPGSQGFFYSRTGNQGPACQFPSVKSCGLWCYWIGCNLKRWGQWEGPRPTVVGCHPSLPWFGDCWWCESNSTHCSCCRSQIFTSIIQARD